MGKINKTDYDLRGKLLETIWKNSFCWMTSEVINVVSWEIGRPTEINHQRQRQKQPEKKIFLIFQFSLLLLPQ